MRRSIMRDAGSSRYYGRLGDITDEADFRARMTRVMQHFVGGRARAKINTTHHPLRR
jgi:hypothetical protein